MFLVHGCVNRTFYTTDGCSMDASNPRYTWPEADLSTTPVRVACPCAGIDSSLSDIEATRVCGGSFSDGINWLSADTSPCQLANQLSEALCTALEVSVVSCVVIKDISLASRLDTTL